MKYKVLVNKEHKIKDNYLSKIELITISCYFQLVGLIF